METQSSRATGDDGYLAIEREDALEALELDVCFSGHADSSYR